MEPKLQVFSSDKSWGQDLEPDLDLSLTIILIEFFTWSGILRLFFLVFLRNCLSEPELMYSVIRTTRGF